MTASFQLRIASGPRQGEVIPLAPGAPVLLGRGHEAQVRFTEDATMSRVHLELAPEGDGWLLRNRSQHGTRVGAARVDAEQRLRPGDELVVGVTHLVFELAGGAAPPATPVATPVATPAFGAVAPEGAGYDSQGVFHMGLTLMQSPGEAHKSQLYLRAPKQGDRGVSIKKRTLYFFLVMLAFALLGCCCASWKLFIPMAANIPGPFAVASFLALLPTVPYLCLYKFLDRNGQIPWRNFLACFLWGASVGCGFSVVMNDLAGDFFKRLAGQGAGDFLTSVIAAPFFEESTKGLAILVVFLILKDEFDNAVEGMILGAAAGLGFALIENCVYDTMFLAKDMSLSQFLWNGTFRMLTCALIGHPVYTSMTGLGFGLAREWGNKSVLRYFMPTVGWALAVSMHALWNASAGLLIPLVFRDNEVMGELALAVFVGGGCALFFFAVLVYSLIKERRVLVKYLSDEVGKGFIEQAELDKFRSLFGREKFVLGGLGKGTYRLRKELRRAQLELAFRKWHLAQGDDVKGSLVDADLLDARSRIRDARNAINAREGLKHARTA